VANRESKRKSITWSVIGGGNGGQSLSAHLALLGFPVRLYDIFEDTIESIRKRGGIEVSGAVTGFGKIELATTDIATAINGADIIMIVAPACPMVKLFLFIPVLPAGRWNLPKSCGIKIVTKP
jgi:opine dehydrogenase